MLEKLASKLGRRDEEPDVELAIFLCEQEDKDGVKEIVNGLKDKDKAVVNDCIKVLYEIGYRKPELIAPYASIFIANLLSKNNRLAWGCMIALSTITDLCADEVFPHLNKIKKAHEVGSVITVDHSITVFAKLCKANENYEKEVFPIIIKHLEQCRPKEIPQHSERALICINSSNAKAFLEVLEKRAPLLTPPQAKRVNKVINEVMKMAQ